MFHQPLRFFLLSALFVCALVGLHAAPLTGVTLPADPPGQGLVGRTVTLTATPTGGSSVEYRFFKVYDGATTTLQPYTLGANSVQVTPSELGQYQFIVWAREVGSATKYYASVVYNVNPPLSAVNLTAGPAWPQAPGTPLTLTATPVNGGQIEYRFYQANPGGSLTLVQPYSTSNTYTVTPSTQGMYQFLVYAREIGSAVTKQAYKSITYNVATPITGVDLATTPQSPGTVGVPVTLTAQATGGFKVQYRYFVQEPGGVYTTIQHYAVGATTCEYTPIAPGSYTFLVWVRETGSATKVHKIYRYDVADVNGIPVSARVMDILNQTPVIGAQVSLGGVAGETDGNGEVALADVPVDAQQLTITREGYTTLDTWVVCADAPQHTWYLIPALLPVDDALVQFRSEQAFAAALALEEQFGALLAQGGDDLTGDELLTAMQASAALARVLENLDAYTQPDEPQYAKSDSRSWLGNLNLFGNAIRFNRGANETFAIKDRILRGEDVPEVNDWLAEHPYAGYTSLALARADSDIFGDYILQKIAQNYLLVNPNSPFKKDVVGAGTDIVIGSYGGTGRSLVGQGMNGIWSGSGTLVTTLQGAATFISKSSKQYIWLFDQALQKWGLIETKPGETATVPSGTFNTLISNGTALRPTSLPGYVVQPSVEQTVPIADISVSHQNSHDGAAMVWVPGGVFTMGSLDGVGNANEHPAHQVTLSGYWIYKYEVTVAQYRAFCAATGRALPPWPVDYGVGFSWANKSGWTDSAVQNHPIVAVTWYDAKAYADWAGVSLPTEAQWEYASRGPQGNNYPWGGMATNYDPHHGWDQTKCANYYNSGYVGISTWPVGSFPAGASWCGAQDLAGNAWEWCADWYGNYSSSPVTNPTGPITGSDRVLRGGSWADYAYIGFIGVWNSRGAFRGDIDPDHPLMVTDFSSYAVGFRCASVSPGP